MILKHSERLVRRWPTRPWQVSGRTWIAAGVPMAWCALAAAQVPPGAVVPALATVVIHGASAPVDEVSVPTAEDARKIIQRTPGAVEVVSDEQWRNTGADTIKSMLEYTPGVFAQLKWGGDTRLSIRGSGLSRYYHLRGITLYQDGVPLTSADGSSDFSAVDPSAYAYTEVYKGANALRYGAATLGGAINFVSPTGLDVRQFRGRADVGSFGHRRVQASTGFVRGQLDGFITGSWQRQDGFRDHSDGNAQRASGNLGWHFGDDAETRFYLSGVRVRQRLPGSVSRDSALTRPRQAGVEQLRNDWQRNDDAVRISNRTAFKRGNTNYELGAWYGNDHLDHPIYQYLDNRTRDYGTFARLTHAAPIAGHDNRLILGVNWQTGKINARNFENNVAQKGVALSHTHDKASNLTLYAEDSLRLTDRVSLIAGLQYLHAQRKRRDLYNGSNPADRSGGKSWNFYNPRVGVIWQAGANWQVFGNVSRSAEPPTFGDMQFATDDALARLRPQRATTFELGTRGEAGRVAWDVALYRARLRNELQCISSPFNICNQTTNLDQTIHQGLEAGLHWTALQGVFTQGQQADSIRLNAAYTYSDFHFSGDRQWGNNRIPGVPRHLLRAETIYHHPSGFYIGPNLEWVPQAYFADNANTLRTQSYALLGLRAGWEHGPYSFYLEGRNLTNRKYIASTSITDRAGADWALFEPGTGRALFAGLQVRF